MQDRIVLDYFPGDVIRVDDVCYEFRRTVQDPVSSATVEKVYGDCYECQTSYKYRKCPVHYRYRICPEAVPSDESSLPYIQIASEELPSSSSSGSSSSSVSSGGSSA